MKRNLFLPLVLVLVFFTVVSCEHIPPDMTGTWQGIEMRTFNYMEDGTTYNNTYYTFWEGERILIFYGNGIWEEKREMATYTGTWELRSNYTNYGGGETYDWELIMRQGSVTKRFFVKEINNSALDMVEVQTLWRCITRYKKVI